ncbi:MAG: hypothetical protein RR543_03100 [Erysipelotrichales bacterium]
MKKIVSVFILFILVFSISGCGKFSGISDKEISPDEIKNIFTDLPDYVDKRVTITGNLFTDNIINGNESVIFDVINENDDINAFFEVEIKKANIDDKTLSKLVENHGIRVTGTIENRMESPATKLYKPTIVTDKIEFIPEYEAINPTIETLDINETVNSKDIEYSVSKIEIAKYKMRAYVTVENKTKYPIVYYDYNTLFRYKGVNVRTGLTEGEPETKCRLKPGEKTSKIVTYDIANPSRTENVGIIFSSSIENKDYDAAKAFIEFNLK